MKTPTERQLNELLSAMTPEERKQLTKVRTVINLSKFELTEGGK